MSRMTTASEAQREIGVLARFVEQWASEGRLQPVGSKGREPLYFDTDVRRLLARMPYAKSPYGPSPYGRSPYA